MSWQAAGAQCAGPSVQEPSVHDSDASVQLVDLAGRKTQSRLYQHGKI